MEVQPACADYVFSISFLDVGIDVWMMTGVLVNSRLHQAPIVNLV
jgi:hypothetical protein